MQCQKCNQHSATIHLTEIHNGQRHEMHLCPACAEQEGLTVKNQVPLNELLNSLLSAQPGNPDQAITPDSTEHISCDTCGMTFDQFKQKALLGCANDYEAFEKPLKTILEKAHNGGTEHTGKVPESVPADQQIQVKLAEMRRRLEQAVRSEDYELAAELRDKIEQLK